MGTIHQVPKKLEIGMAVVVWIKPEYKLVGDAEREKLTKEVWLKGKICGSIYQKGIVFVVIDDLIFSDVVPGLIIVRSTALADNLTDAAKARALRKQAAKKHKQLVASVKIVRSVVR